MFEYTSLQTIIHQNHSTTTNHNQSLEDQPTTTTNQDNQDNHNNQPRQPRQPQQPTKTTFTYFPQQPLLTF